MHMVRRALLKFFGYVAIECHEGNPVSGVSQLEGSNQRCGFATAGYGLDDAMTAAILDKGKYLPLVLGGGKGDFH